MPSSSAMQKIVPYLVYEDAPGAIAFLTRAFGFEERLRYEMENARIGHAEVASDDNVVTLASASEGFGTSPVNLAAIHGQTYYFVADVDAHYARAREGGATSCSEPTENHGVRSYRAMDPEGHRWIFATRLEEKA